MAADAADEQSIVPIGGRNERRFVWKRTTTEIRRVLRLVRRDSSISTMIVVSTSYNVVVFVLSSNVVDLFDSFAPVGRRLEE